jgi:hypothetical protein
VERALGKLLTDENFRERFLTNPEIGGHPLSDRAHMSEQIVQQPAFERRSPETNGHTSVANGHTASAPAPAPSRNARPRIMIAGALQRPTVDRANHAVVELHARLL